MMDTEIKRALHLGVPKAQYTAAAGPAGKSRVFTREQIQAGILYVSRLRGIPCLYIPQITSVLALLEGKHVVSRLVTGVGKTFAYECLVNLSEFLYDGDPTIPGFVRTWCPVIWVLEPLTSLMVEQSASTTI